MRKGDQPCLNCQPTDALPCLGWEISVPLVPVTNLKTECTDYIFDERIKQFRRGWPTFSMRQPAVSKWNDEKKLHSYKVLFSSNVRSWREVFYKWKLLQTNLDIRTIPEGVALSGENTENMFLFVLALFIETAIRSLKVKHSLNHFLVLSLQRTDASSPMITQTVS